MASPPLVAWTAWGFGVLSMGLASLAVIGLQPVPGQHAVVGTAMPLLAALGALVTWASGAVVGARAAVLGLAVLLAWLAAAALQGFLHGLWFQGEGGHTLAPILLASAATAAAVGPLVRSPVAVTVLGVGLSAGGYVWASLSWDSATAAGTLFGGAVLSAACLLLFVALGCLDTWWRARSDAA